MKEENAKKMAMKGLAFGIGLMTDVIGVITFAIRTPLIIPAICVIVGAILMGVGCDVFCENDEDSDF